MSITVTRRHAKLATVLANAAADYVEATRPSVEKTTMARLDGAALAANALGLGMTPAEVLLTALDFVRANPRPARGGAFPTELKAWSASVADSLAEALDGLL